MPIDLPSNLIKSTEFSPQQLNYTPLQLRQESQSSPGNKKLYIKMLLFLVVIGSFSSVFFYVFKNSSARSLTSDAEFMNDVATMARSRKIVVEEEDRTIIIHQRNLFTILVDNIKTMITGEKPAEVVEEEITSEN